jgi:hypothetical protein
VAKHVGGQFKNILKGILNKCSIAAKVMHRLLSEEEEKTVNTCQDLSDRLQRDLQFPSNIIITDDEALVYRMTHKPSKSQQKTPSSPHPKKGMTRSPKCKRHASFQQLQRCTLRI